MAKNKLWFRNKKYGWGWYPATWQGWLVLVIFIILLIGSSIIRFEIDPIFFIFRTSVLIIGLIYICYKTGEKPRWRWGK